MILIPNSWGTDLREHNDCHNPGGRDGGQFCSKGASPAEAHLAKRFNLQTLGSRRFMIEPHTLQTVLGYERRAGTPELAGSSHAEEFFDTTGSNAHYDNFLKGFITGPYAGAPSGRIDLYHKYYADDAEGFDAYYNVIHHLVRNGAKADTIVTGLTRALGPDVFPGIYTAPFEYTLGQAFPEMFKKRRR